MAEGSPAQRLGGRGLRPQIVALSQALSLVWRAAGRRTLWWGILLMVQGLLPAALVILTRSAVDGLVAGLKTGGDWQRLLPALLPLIWMVLVTLLMEVLASLLQWLHSVQGHLVQDYAKEQIHRKSAAVDFALYEQPEFYDHLHQVRYEAGTRPVELLERLGSLLQNSVTLLAIGVVLLPYGIWVPVLLVLSGAPALGVVAFYALRKHRWHLRATAEERRTVYYEWLLTAREPAAELRLFGLGDHFRTLYQTIRARLRGESLALEKAHAWASLGAGVFALCVTGGALALLLDGALKGRITLGGLALFYQAFQQGQRLMRTLLSDVGRLYALSLFLERLFAFLDLKPQIADRPGLTAPALPSAGSEIRFQQVTFRYPGSERAILTDFSLALPIGKTVAIVGTNGAGKSTLLKLLCRLYEPETGCVTIGGKDLREIPLQTLHEWVSVVFQEPVRYSATAAENIALGSLETQPDRAAIEAAARNAGAHDLIQQLPQGYDTLLEKGFEQGEGLSAGQWQRIALARALLRPATILLLDEPTSALDAWAEEAWLQRFRGLAAGRTVLIITHRFTTAMHADSIYVMDAGEVVEAGTHRELLALGGRYAHAWTTQRQTGEVGNNS